MFLDTVVYVATRFNEKVVHDVKTHFKQVETFQYTHFTKADLSEKKRRPITADFQIWEVHFGPWEISRLTL